MIFTGCYCLAFSRLADPLGIVDRILRVVPERSAGSFRGRWRRRSRIARRQELPSPELPARPASGCRAPGWRQSWPPMATSAMTTAATALSWSPGCSSSIAPMRRQKRRTTSQRCRISSAAWSSAFRFTQPQRLLRDGSQSASCRTILSCGYTSSKRQCVRHQVAATGDTHSVMATMLP